MKSISHRFSLYFQMLLRLVLRAMYCSQIQYFRHFRVSNLRISEFRNEWAVYLTTLHCFEYNALLSKTQTNTMTVLILIGCQNHMVQTEIISGTNHFQTNIFVYILCSCIFNLKYKVYFSKKKSIIHHMMESNRKLLMFFYEN